jgi:hypothetical protein
MAMPGVFGSFSVQTTFSDLSMMPWWTISASTKIGFPFWIAAVRGFQEIRRDAEIGGDLRHAAGVDDARGDACASFGSLREIGLALDDLEGARVDGLGVAEVGNHFFIMLLGPSG